MVLGLALGPASASGGVYKFVDGKGRVHYSDQPAGPGWRPVESIRTPATSMADENGPASGGEAARVIYRRAPDPRQSDSFDARRARVYLGRSLNKSAALAILRFNKRRFSPLIDRVADTMSLEAALVHAVVRAESAYDPSAVSKKGAVGLMQLMPDTAHRYGVRDRYDPRQNLSGGSRYLRDLLDRFEDLALALAAYNAGESAVIDYGGQIPPFPETQQYVRRVMTFYEQNRAPVLADVR